MFKHTHLCKKFAARFTAFPYTNVFLLLHVYLGAVKL
jgi:hypothetical protein